ncbi:MAG TPA: Ig-like domain-containing protein, partial [Armatimonadota bacterium]
MFTPYRDSITRQACFRARRPANVGAARHGSPHAGGLHRFLPVFLLCACLGLLLQASAAFAAPVATNDAFFASKGTALTVAAPGVLGNDTDPDGRPLTAILVTAPDPTTGTLTLNADGSFTFTPGTQLVGGLNPDGTFGFTTVDWVGTTTFTYKANNGLLDSPVATVTITMDPPPVATGDVFIAPRGIALTVAAPGVLGNDTDPNGRPLTAVLVTAPDPTTGTLTLNADGSFTFTPATQVVGGLNPDGTFGFTTIDWVGTTTFTYKANNGLLDSAVVTVTVTMDAPPPVATNDAYLASKGTALTVAAPGVLGNDTDPNGRPLTAVLVTAPDPTTGTLALNADGSFTFTPGTQLVGGLNPDGTFGFTTVDWVGTTTFTYKANNGLLDSPAATVTITMDPPPVAMDDVFIAPRGIALTVAAPGVLGNDTDPNGRPLTAVLVTAPDPTTGTLTFNADGSFIFTPSTQLVGGLNPDGTFGFTTVDWVGTTTFTYKANNGLLDSQVVTVTITMDAPPIALDDSYSLVKNTTLMVAAPGVLGNDTDPNGLPLTAVLVTPPNPASGTLTLNSDGAFSFAPATDWAGTTTFTYKANDGILDSTVATVTLKVNGPPVAVDDLYGMTAGTTLTVAAPGVLANDTDPNGDPLTAILVTPPDPTTGNVMFNADGSFTFTPTTKVVGVLNPDGTFTFITTDWAGTTTFTYKANDGIADSNTATVTLTVNGPPVAHDDTYYTDAGTTLTVAAPGVLANDTDPNGDPLTAILVTPPDPTTGTLTLNADGSLTFTPATQLVGVLNPDGTFSFITIDWVGTTTFTYKANDGLLDSNIATVTITMNAPPVAVDDEYRTPMNTTLTVVAPGILGNDTDQDGDPLQAILVTPPAPATGSLTLNADGGFVFTPALNYVGNTTFTYKANDGHTNSAVATVTIKVNAAPIAIDDSYIAYKGSSLTVPAPGVLLNDTDINDDVLTAIKVSDPTHGALVFNSDGSFTYTPASNWLGVDTFQYKANDGLIASNTATVTITTAAVNWPQFQRGGTHVGSLGVPPVVFPAPTSLTGPGFDSSKLRWSVRTGGTVRSSVAVVQNPAAITLPGVINTTQTMLAGSATLSVDSTNGLHVGDPLLIDNDYLGPIRAIDGNQLTVAYTATVDHPATTIAVAVYRQDTLRGAVSNTATSIVVNHPERFMVADQLQVEAEVMTVTGISVATLTVTRTAPVSHANGALVRVGRPGVWMAYAGSDDGKLYAIEPDTGSSIWAATANEYLGAIRGTPVIDADLGRVYVTSVAGRVFAFATSGEFLWAYPKLTDSALGAMNASPVVDDAHNVYFVADGGTKNLDGTFQESGIYKLDANGVLSNSYLFPTSERHWPSGIALYNNSDTTAWRVVVGTRVKNAVTGEESGRVYCLDAALTAPLVYPDDLATPTVVGPITATPIIDATGTIYIGDANGSAGRVHAVRETLNAGFLRIQSVWDPALPVYATAAPVTTSAAVTPDGAKVYVGDAAGNLYAFFPADTTKNRKAKVLNSAIVGPLALDAGANGGNVVASGAAGEVGLFPAMLGTEATTPGLTDIVGYTGLWQWVAPTTPPLAVRTAPTVWNSPTGMREVIVGSDDGYIYAIGPAQATPAARPVNNSLVPATSWPLFHRDPRRLGQQSGQAGVLEPGPQQPTLRWFADLQSVLSSSAVVSDRTPDGSTRVYMGSESGRVFAYDASTGKLIWEYPIDADPALGPIRATPAVAEDGTIAVTTTDGYLYLVTPNGTLRTGGINPVTLPGAVLSSPAIGKSGMVYLATADSGQAVTPALDGAEMTATYAFASPVTITRVRFQTTNKGILSIYRRGVLGDPAYIATFPDETTTPRYITVDLAMEGQTFVWTSQSDTLDIANLTISTAGTLQAVTPALFDVTTASVATDLATFTTAETAADEAKIEARFATPTWVHTVGVNTTNNYTLSLVDANGAVHTWGSYPATASATETTLVDRLVTKVIWTKLDLSATNLTEFSMTSQDTTESGGRLYAYDMLGTLQWQYPANGNGYLAPITSSPAVLTDAITQKDLVYASTTGGQTLAMDDTGLLWNKQNFTAITASPVVADNPRGGDV